MISTLWSGLTWREALLVGWIQPRGVVAVAVAGLFAAELQAIGRPGGSIFVPLAFALVFATVLAAGFTIGPVSKLLKQNAGGGDGVMIVGAIRGARLEGHATFYGEVLSENADMRLDHSAFNHIIAATPNDAYNALVCVEFAPELGRHRVFQVSGGDKDDDDGRISEEYTLDDFFEARGEDTDLLLVKKTDGALEFVQPGTATKIEKGTLLSYSAKSD